MSNRDASGKDFDPSSFDDVLELVSTWTKHRSMTASQLAEDLRARGVVVRATTSGRHIIIESRGRYPNEPREAKLFVMPRTSHEVRQWFGRARDPSPRFPHVIRPPGQALHRVAGLFSKRTRERVLDPIIADMQLEYCEELGGERPRKAKLWLVQARAWVAFAEAIFLRTVVGRIIKGISQLV
ncbi:MAG: hypothetical protein ABR499_05795 [Gemmatimonadaceae bacterium]